MDGTGPHPQSRNTHIISTERLDLTLPEPEDARRLFALVGGEQRREVCGTLVWDGPDSLDEIKHWIARCHDAVFEEWGYHWVIRDRTGTFAPEQGAVMGAIGTRPRDTPGRADVGYWLGVPYWGRGIMNEALSALLDRCFSDFDMSKVEADVFAENARGRRLVESVGMSQEGTIRHAYRKYGRWVDMATYGILAAQWRNR